MDLKILRALAGIPSKPLMEKHGHYEPVEHPQTEVPIHDPAGGKGGADSPPAKGVKDEPKEEVPEFSEIVVTLAKKIAGLKGDALIAMVDKIYQAGIGDGKAQASSDGEVPDEEESEEDAEELDDEELDDEESEEKPKDEKPKDKKEKPKDKKDAKPKDDDEGDDY